MPLPPKTDNPLRSLARPQTSGLPSLRIPGVPSAGKRLPPKRTVKYSRTTNKMFVNGALFDADDADAALEAEQYLKAPPQPNPPTDVANDWEEVGPENYKQYTDQIRNPGVRRLMYKNFGLGVDSFQLRAGRGLQLVGAEKLGQSIVDRNAEQLRRNSPYQRPFTSIDSGGDVVDWFAANLAQQGPNILGLIATSILTGGASTAVAGGTVLARSGATVARLFGQKQFQKRVVEAAKRHVKGEANKADKNILRGAGALAGSSLFGYATGAGEIYGELRDTGSTADDTSSRLISFAGAIPFAALSALPEFAIGARIFPGVSKTQGGRTVRKLQTGGKLKRLGKGFAAGGALEGVTEAAQEGLLLGAGSLENAEDYSDEYIARLVDSFAAGFGVGGPIGGLANLAPNEPANLMDSGEQEADVDAEPEDPGPNLVAEFQQTLDQQDSEINPSEHREGATAWLRAFATQFLSEEHVQTVIEPRLEKQHELNDEEFNVLFSEVLEEVNKVREHLATPAQPEVTPETPPPAAAAPPPPATPPKRTLVPQKPGQQALQDDEGAVLTPEVQEPDPLPTPPLDQQESRDELKRRKVRKELERKSERRSLQGTPFPHYVDRNKVRPVTEEDVDAELLKVEDDIAFSLTNPSLDESRTRHANKKQATKQTKRSLAPATPPTVTPPWEKDPMGEFNQAMEQAADEFEEGLSKIKEEGLFFSPHYYRIGALSWLYRRAAAVVKHPKGEQYMDKVKEFVKKSREHLKMSDDQFNRFFYKMRRDVEDMENNINRGTGTVDLDEAKPRGVDTTMQPIEPDELNESPYQQRARGILQTNPGWEENAVEVDALAERLRLDDEGAPKKKKVAKKKAAKKKAAKKKVVKKKATAKKKVIKKKVDDTIEKTADGEVIPRRFPNRPILEVTPKQLKEVVTNVVPKPTAATVAPTKQTRSVRATEQTKQSQREAPPASKRGAEARAKPKATTPVAQETSVREDKRELNKVVTEEAVNEYKAERIALFAKFKSETARIKSGQKAKILEESEQAREQRLTSLEMAGHQAYYAYVWDAARAYARVFGLAKDTPTYEEASIHDRKMWALGVHNVTTEMEEEIELKTKKTIMRDEFGLYKGIKSKAPTGTFNELVKRLLLSNNTNFYITQPLSNAYGVSDAVAQTVWERLIQGNARNKKLNLFKNLDDSTKRDVKRWISEKEVDKAHEHENLKELAIKYRKDMVEYLEITHPQFEENMEVFSSALDRDAPAEDEDVFHVIRDVFSMLYLNDDKNMAKPVGGVQGARSPNSIGHERVMEAVKDMSARQLRYATDALLEVINHKGGATYGASVQTKEGKDKVIRVVASARDKKDKNIPTTWFELATTLGIVTPQNSQPDTINVRITEFPTEFQQRIDEEDAKVKATVQREKEARAREEEERLHKSQNEFNKQLFGTVNPKLPEGITDKAVQKATIELATLIGDIAMGARLVYDENSKRNAVAQINRLAKSPAAALGMPYKNPVLLGEGNTLGDYFSADGNVKAVLRKSANDYLLDIVTDIDVVGGNFNEALRRNEATAKIHAMKESRKRRLVGGKDKGSFDLPGDKPALALTGKRFSKYTQGGVAAPVPIAGVAKEEGTKAVGSKDNLELSNITLQDVKNFGSHFRNDLGATLKATAGFEKGSVIKFIKTHAGEDVGKAIEDVISKARDLSAWGSGLEKPLPGESVRTIKEVPALLEALEDAIEKANIIADSSSELPVGYSSALSDARVGIGDLRDSLNHEIPSIVLSDSVASKDALRDLAQDPQLGDTAAEDWDDISGNFSRVEDGQNINRPLPIGNAKLRVRQWISKLKVRPEVHVYRNVQELKKQSPELFKIAAAGRMPGELENTPAAGYSVGSKIFLFTDNIKTKQHLDFVLAHETLGHFGLRSLFSKKELNALLSEVYDSDPYIRSLTDTFREIHAGVGKLEAIEEVLANKAGQVELSSIRRLWNAIKDLLNRLFGMTFEDDMARYVVGQARRYVKTGYTINRKAPSFSMTKGEYDASKDPRLKGTTQGGVVFYHGPSEGKPPGKKFLTTRDKTLIHLHPKASTSTHADASWSVPGWFTTSKHVASRYSSFKDDAVKVDTVHIALSKPINLSFGMTGNEFLKTINNISGFNPRILSFRISKDSFEGSPDHRLLIDTVLANKIVTKAAGYDGVVISDPTGTTATIAVPFNSHQIINANTGDNMAAELSEPVTVASIAQRMKRLDNEATGRFSRVEDDKVDLASRAHQTYVLNRINGSLTELRDLTASEGFQQMIAKMGGLESAVSQALGHVQSNNYRAKRSKGMQEFLRIKMQEGQVVANGRTTLSDITKLSNSARWPWMKEESKGPTLEQQDTVGEMLVYNAIRKRQELTEGIVKAWPRFFNVYKQQDGTFRYKFNESSFDRAVQRAIPSAKTFAEGFSIKGPLYDTFIENDPAGEKSKQKRYKLDITEDSIEYKVFVEQLQAMAYTAKIQLKMKYEAAKTSRLGALDTIENIIAQFKGGELNTKDRELSRLFFDDVMDVYKDIQHEGLEIHEGNIFHKEEAREQAAEFIRSINRALWHGEKAKDWADNTANSETARFEGDRFALIRSLIIQMKDLGLDKDASFQVTNRIQNHFLYEHQLLNAEYAAKTTVLGAYTPLTREGKYQVQMQAYNVKDNTPVRMDEVYKEAMYYAQSDSMAAITRQQKELDKIFTGAEFTVFNSAGQEVVVRLRAERSDARQTPPLTDPKVNYNHAVDILTRLNTNLTPKARENLVINLTKHHSLARKHLMRSGNPGWKRNGLSPHSEFLETSIHVAGNNLHRHELTDLSLNDAMWLGDKAKLKRLLREWEEAEASGNPSKAFNARERYEAYAHQYQHMAPAAEGETILLGGKQVKTLGRGERDREEMKKMQAWYSNNQNILSASEDALSTGVAARLKLMTVLFHLSLSPAASLINYSSMIHNALPTLATYNPKTGYGGGHGYGKSTVELWRAARTLADPKMSKTSHLLMIRDLLRNPETRDAAQEKYGMNFNEVAAILRMTQGGTLEAAQYNALVGTQRGGVTSAWAADMVRWAMYMFTYTEQHNRRMTALATYRMKYDRNIAAGMDESSAYLDAEKAGAQAVIDTQGDYSLLNRPALGRGNFFQFVYVFKMFSIISIEAFTLMPPQGRLAFLAFLFLTSGLKGLFFAEDIMDLIDTLAQLFGISIGSVEKAAAKMIDSVMPGMTYPILNGFINEFSQITASSRLGFGNLIPGSSMFVAGADTKHELLNFAGPVASGLVGALATAGDLATYGAEVVGLKPDTSSFNSILRKSPLTSIRAISDGLTYLSDGRITNSQGKVVTKDVSTMVIISRLMGFYPTSATKQNDIVRLSKRAASHAQDIKTAFVTSYVKAYLSNDNARMDEIRRDVQRWNKQNSGTEYEIRNFMLRARRAAREAQKPTLLRYRASAGKNIRPETEELARILGVDL